MKRALLLGALLVCAACPPPPKPPEPPPGAPTCADYCHHVAELGCEAARPTAKGASCVDVCANVQSSGAVAWDLGCRTKAVTCDEVDRCEAGR